MLHTLSTLPEHPESVPVNALLAVEGTPLEKSEVIIVMFKPPPPINPLLSILFIKPVDIWNMLRMISTTRIVLPKSMVRLSAGRVNFTSSEQVRRSIHNGLGLFHTAPYLSLFPLLFFQAMCFFAGANSIFTGDKLLTTPNNSFSEDQHLFKILGIEPLTPQTLMK